jgi:hypothetical protein
MKILLAAIGLFFLVFPSRLVLAEEERVDPSEDPRCWVHKTCIADADDDGTPDGRFDGDESGEQKSEAAKEACGDNYSFCYPPAVNYNLSIGIPLTGTVTTSVADLGDYIDKVYKYLLAISMIIAVIMMMVGGLQYISSPSGQEASKAKERIVRSLTGMILLMCAALILATVNPQLINLEMPAIPKLRTVFFISDSTTCEDLIASGQYTIEPKTGLCGGEDGKITAVQGVAVNPADQESCRWGACQNANAVCLSPTTEGAKPACYSCSTVNNDRNIEKSSSVCSRLAPKDTANINYDCLFSSEGINSCKLLTLDCSAISSCSDYVYIPIITFTAELVRDCSDDDINSYIEENICTINDPCGKGPCQYEVPFIGDNVCEADDVRQSLTAP